MDVLKDWLTTFGLIIIKPSPQTFLLESGKAKGKFTSTILWLEFVVLALNIQAFLVKKTFSIPLFLYTVLFLPIVFLFFVFCIHTLYKRMYNRKKDHYTQLLYLTTGIFVPFVIIYLYVALIPVVGEVLSWASLIYILILTVIAVTAITKLKVWQSVVVVFLGTLLASAGFFCIPAFFLSLMQAVPRVF